MIPAHCLANGHISVLKEKGDIGVELYGDHKLVFLTDSRSEGSKSGEDSWEQWFQEGVVYLPPSWNPPVPAHSGSPGVVASEVVPKATEPGERQTSILNILSSLSGYSFSWDRSLEPGVVTNSGRGTSRTPKRTKK